ncbi:MAG TPA: hypothetical protein VK920_00085, partial [Solirubrobacterales bacterium]|nr:hypothetical protein [Solirubrobacterales bacterium]
FAYRAEGAPRGSTIALADGEPVALAGLDLAAASLSAAIALFGPPTTHPWGSCARPSGGTSA